MSLRQFVVRYLRKRFTRKKIRRAVLGRLPDVVHVGARAVCKRVSMDGKPYIKKSFAGSAVGRACFERELAAQEIFEGRPWLAPVVKTDRHWMLVPQYPAERRLDHLASALDEPERLRIAKQAVEILFDIFLQGYAHRDYHARNLFLIDGQLIVIDFEVLGAHPSGCRPPFPLSYDLTGEGLDSPFETKRMF
ncbi:MAG: phosphotransferase, partial [Planctomycetes bacterium]|nr:phosphotransferase [Planctomycetota bacterium]